ncbi:KRR1 small subunit processome component homolog [Prunus yedoensis var. nudiflora]|uniref:KRR1 small subunit processome component homolog n=1 Tax=Prunus yedoensis var. nudiflora TaxID=2094558 RepID=A0A314YVB9_PRUYE|nr:KRR1 small subunit processome component homolog [Prunus yedoensis var. nudiflora]
MSDQVGVPARQDDYRERKKHLMAIPEKELGQFTGYEVYVRPRNGLVAAIGPVEGLKVVRKFVTDCIVDNADPLSLMSQYKFVLEWSGGWNSVSL